MRKIRRAAEPITQAGVRRELSLLIDKKRLDAATVTVYVGPAQTAPAANEKRFYLSRFGVHVGVFAPVPGAMDRANN